eukprot:2953081-Lingulodinium_polyedra.AAC.1
MIRTYSRPSQPRSLSATGPSTPGGALASNSFSIDVTSSWVNWQLKAMLSSFDLNRLTNSITVSPVVMSDSI